jgi:hypothetical protein
MIDEIVERQAALITALDAGDADAILSASAGLVEKLGALRTRSTTINPEKIQYALKQAHAAAIRVNYLAHFTRQKLDRLAQHRGQKPGLTYIKPQNGADIDA